ncbi:MAG: beta-lactamase family protein [Flavobacteriales bacterium]|nr:beta-lactamase family protein [Flavobacteriales bacterium]
MKKRITFVMLFVTFGLFATWVVEPLSLNPFKEIVTPSVESTINYDCEQSNSQSDMRLKKSADTILDKYMDLNEFLGVSAGFFKEGCGTYIAGAGFSSKRDNSKASSIMLSRIASITKPMTAIAIMQLYERGVLDLDAPIQAYLDDFPRKTEGKITIRELLRHTSGVPHYSSKIDAISFKNYSSLADAVDSFKLRELRFKPGEAYEYSSYGYTILGAILEKVSGVTYEEYMKNNIWLKAGMLNTSLERDGIYQNKSRLYLKVKSTYIRSPYTNLSVIYPAGGVQSTVEDLLKFGAAVINNELIGRDTLEMMIDVTNSLAPTGGDDPYGFGWSVYDTPAHGRMIAHSGSQLGASAYFSIYLDEKIVTAVLSNAFGTKNSAYHLSKEISDLIM